MTLLKNINFSDYQAIKAINISSLKELKKSPEHFRSAIDYPREASEAQVLGSALHRMILEPDLFENDYYVLPNIDRRTKAGKEQYTSIVEANLNLTPIPEADYKVLQGTYKSFQKSPNWSTLYQTKHLVEQPFTFNWLGVECKGQADMICEASGEYALVDLKTTSNFFGFKHEIKKYGYLDQLAWYGKGLELNGMQMSKYYLVAIEKSYPYKIAVWKIQKEVINHSMLANEKLLLEYKARCEHEDWTSDLVYNFGLNDL